MSGGSATHAGIGFQDKVTGLLARRLEQFTRDTLSSLSHLAHLDVPTGAGTERIEIHRNVTRVLVEHASVDIIDRYRCARIREVRSTVFGCSTVDNRRPSSCGDRRRPTSGSQPG